MAYLPIESILGRINLTGRLQLIFLYYYYYYFVYFIHFSSFVGLLRHRGLSTSYRPSHIRICTVCSGFIHFQASCIY